MVFTVILTLTPKISYNLYLKFRFMVYFIKIINKTIVKEVL